MEFIEDGLSATKETRMAILRNQDGKIIIQCSTCKRQIRTNEKDLEKADAEARKNHPDWYIGYYGFQGYYCPEHKRYESPV